ncbi:hypothetical protein SDC9_102385 [bioreactor metagenome]|uniref:Uncharacterized protein n=1 Tax=bioreactor metagenome TaxID=1076179 RepID=A0A645AS47_9ZZZZ
MEVPVGYLRKASRKRLPYGGFQLVVHCTCNRLGHIGGVSVCHLFRAPHQDYIIHSGTNRADRHAQCKRAGRAGTFRTDGWNSSFQL